MDFNLDDPLGDLLSEGSNDSFFETAPSSTAKKKTSTPAKSSTLEGGGGGSSSSIKTATIASITVPQQKTKVEDLFGIKSTSESTSITGTTAITKKSQSDLIKLTSSVPQQQQQPQIIEPQSKQEQNVSASISYQKYQQSTEAFNDDDLISDLGFDPKKPKNTKSNILDDLLAPIESSSLSLKKSSITTPPITTTSRPFTAAPILTNIQQKDESKVVSRQSTDTTESTVPGTYTASLPRPKTAGGGRRQSISSSINDPLGFFGPPSTTTAAKDKDSTDTKDFQQEPITMKVKRKGTTADWLGLDTTDNKIQQQSQQQLKETTIGGVGIMRPQSPAPPPYQKDSQQGQFLVMPPPLQPPPPAQPSSSLPTIESLSSIQNPIITASSHGAMLFATTALDTQNALQTLQQQEVQVQIAAQVRNQELALQEMHKRQQDLLRQQEIKFNELLQKQLHRQSQLEGAIKSQQERINAHIQLLMTQGGSPPFIGSSTGTGKIKPTKSENEEESSHDHDDDQEFDEIHLKAEVKKLQLEKLRLEDLVSNINGNHEKEIEFMDNSHRKQIQLLEQNEQSLENRLQNELKSLEEFYVKKLQTLEEERKTLIEQYEKKLQDLRNENEEIVQKLKTNHEIDIENLKKDYQKMVENIRQSKLLEFSAIQENGSYMDTLRNAANHLETASGDLQNLKEEMYRKIDLANKEREMKLELREKKLEDAERHLKLTEESSEQEKNRLIELIATLETQLNKLTHDNSDEKWNMRQKLSVLEAERTAFEREKQYLRDQFARDEKRIEELKSFQLQENHRLMQEIQDERQFLAMEKAKLETAKKLHSTPTNIQKTEGELETALKVAQDATKQADHERERYFKMQRNLEAKRRELLEEENTLRQKEDELEAIILSNKTKEKRLDDEMRKYRLIEQNFHVKVQLLHNQMRQITEREAQISQDRLILSKERLEIQELKRKLNQTKCSLCRIGEKSVEISKLLTMDQGNNANNPIGEVKPLSRILNFEGNNDVLHDRIDNFLDQEVLDSLKRLETASNLSINFPDDLNDPMSLGIANVHHQSSNIVQPIATATNNVPTNFLDSEIMTLNFDIKKNFIDE